MATIQVPVDEIVTEAGSVRPSRVLLTLFLGVFWVTGWIAGRAWLGAVMCAISVRRGWRDAMSAPGVAVPAHRGAR